MLALPGKEQPKEKTLTKGYSVEASGKFSGLTLIKTFLNVFYFDCIRSEN